MSRATDGERLAHKVLVVGIGNPVRGDDAIGAAVAKALAGRLPDNVAIRTRAGDMLALIDDWDGFDALICIDAAVPMGTPGRIHRIDPKDEPLPRDPVYASSHAFGVAEAIGLGQALNSAPRNIVVFAIEGASFERGAPMTPEVAAAIDEVADRVVAEVAQLMPREEAALVDA